VDSATLPMQVTARHTAEVLVTVVGTAGAAVFSEGSVRALAGVMDTVEASEGKPFIPHGVPPMAQRMGPYTAIPMG
jgi:hypothetical protein